MTRCGLITLSFLVAGCATETVRTPNQAIEIAQSSVCAQHEVNLAPNQTMSMVWLAERSGDRWIAWHQFGQTSVWISAKNGNILSCENVAVRPTGIAPLAKVDSN